MIKNRLIVISILSLLLLLAVGIFFIPARAVSSTTLSPVSYTTTRGGDGRQPVSNLHAKDQSDTQDDWNKYVEFKTPSANTYAGYRTYQLPTGLTAASIASLRVEANYLGPRKSYQTWTWRIRSFALKTWVTIGNNSAAADWRWSLLSFDVPGNVADYVSSNGEIRVQIISNNTRDNADLDFEAVIVTTGDNPTPLPTTPPTLPPTLTITPTPTTPQGIWHPAPGTSWQWQLTGTIDTSFDVDMYDIDLFEAPQATINQLHADGRIVICYFSAGSWEDWRPDAGDFPASVKGKSNGWPGEVWLDVRALPILAPIMEARMDLAVQKDCDGVEPDLTDGYANDTGFPLAYQDQITYNVWLAEAAHARGLSVGLKNDVDQVPDLVDDFDWALNEQCFEYDECETLLPFVEAGKAVFGVEYVGATSSFCPQANAMNFDWLKKNLDLDAYRVACR